MKLIIQPDAGVTPIVNAIKSAKKTLDVVIFRFDRLEVEKALEQAVDRGVTVRALIAHTNKGGEKPLKKLALRLHDAGLTVSRTADDLPRYHGKMMLVDKALHVYGFNFTKLDIDKSRSFGVVTRHPRLVREARKLFEADFNRRGYCPALARFVVSPENSRTVLTNFIRSSKKQLLIYDHQVSDNLVRRALLERAKAGVDIRVIGSLEKPIDGIKVRELADLRLHVRALVRDGEAAFIGSQSLRKLELDGRREVGVVADAHIARQVASVFEQDWRAAKKPATAN